MKQRSILFETFCQEGCVGGGVVNLFLEVHTIQNAFYLNIQKIRIIIILFL